MCGIQTPTVVQQGCGPAPSLPAPATASPTTSVAAANETAPTAPAGKSTTPPPNAALDAQVGEMLTRMAQKPDFDGKNAVFHEYFDKVPESDVATRQTFFFNFMANIPKADAERVAKYLESLGPKPAPAPAPAAAVTPNASTAPAGVLMIGDSLSVGTDPFFGDEQTGVPTQVDAKSGRSLSQGMDIYNSVAVKPRVVQMALFTNNTPGQIDSLRAALDRTIADARARGGRVVWATIVGNPKFGSYDAVNSMLRDYAARNADVMGLVDWAQMTRDNPSYLGGDGYHGSAAGYRARAEAFAQASKV